jgi:hypothetical protein
MVANQCQSKSRDKKRERWYQWATFGGSKGFARTQRVKRLAPPRLIPDLCVPKSRNICKDLTCVGTKGRDLKGGGTFCTQKKKPLIMGILALFKGSSTVSHQQNGPSQAGHQPPNIQSKAAFFIVGLVLRAMFTRPS